MKTITPEQTTRAETIRDLKDMNIPELRDVMTDKDAPLSRRKEAQLTLRRLQRLATLGK